MIETPSVVIPGEKMGLGNLLKRTYDVFYASFGQAILVMLCFMFPGLLITNFTSALLTGMREIASNGIDPNHINWQVLGPTIGISLAVVGILGLTLFLLGQIMIILLVEKKRLGQQASFHGLLTETLAAYGRTLPVYILLCLGTFFAFLLLVIPGIYVSVVWAFVLPLVVLRPSVKHVFAASKRLVAGRWWKTLGYLIVIMLLDYCISHVLGVPERILENTFSSILAQAYLNPWTGPGIGILVLHSLATMLSGFSLFTTSSEVVMLSAYEANPVVVE